MSWPPSVEPIAHGDPGSRSPGVQRVVGSLAVLAADRVDGRQVEHVEAHGGDIRQSLGGRAERAALDRAVLQALGALRAGEELVPGADAGALALDEQLVRRRRRSRATSAGGRRRTRRSRDPGRCRGRPRRRRIGSRRAAAAPSSARRSAIGRPFSLTARSNSRAPVSRMSGTSTPAAIFSSAACSQVAKSSANASNRNDHTPCSSGDTSALQRSKPSFSGTQAVQGLVAGGREEPQMHADEVVPLAERRHGERHDLAGEGLGPELAARNGGPRMPRAECARSPCHGSPGRPSPAGAGWRSRCARRSETDLERFGDATSRTYRGPHPFDRLATRLDAGAAARLLRAEQVHRRSRQRHDVAGRERARVIARALVLARPQGDVARHSGDRGQASPRWAIRCRARSAGCG